MAIYIPDRKVLFYRPSYPIICQSPITEGLSLVYLGGETSRTVFPNAINIVTGAKNVATAEGLVTGFNTNYGTSSTDSVVTSKTDYATTRTYIARVFVCSANNSNLLSRVFDKLTGSNAQSELLYVRQTTGLNYFIYGRNRTTASGEWSTPSNSVSPNSWQTIAVTYDSSSPANAPTLYIDGSPVTVSTVISPSGSLINTSSEYVIGNRTNDNARCFTGYIQYVYFFDRILSPAEIYSLSQNPWQIFKPARRWFTIAQATNVQLLSPSADISFGNWTPSTGSTLYGVIDETIADDSDYIQATTSSTCEIKLASGGDPFSSSGHILRYRLLAGSGTLTVILKCGSTTIASWDHSLSGVAQDIVNTLTGTQADSITDYSDLRVVFTS